MSSPHHHHAPSSQHTTTYSETSGSGGSGDNPSSTGGRNMMPSSLRYYPPLNRAIDPSPAVRENVQMIPQSKIQNIIYPLVRKFNSVSGDEMEANQSHASGTKQKSSSNISRRNTRRKLVLFVAGAGTMAVEWLFSQPGASRHIIDVQIPYSVQASSQLTIPVHKFAFRQVQFYKVAQRSNEESDTMVTHFEIPENSASMVSFQQARYLSVAAYRRGLSLLAPNSLRHQMETSCFGVGATGAISTWKDRRGMNHAYLASWNGNEGNIHYLRMKKQFGSRLDEESVVSSFIMKTIAEEHNIDYHPEDKMEILEEECRWKVKAHSNTERLEQFLSSNSDREETDFLIASNNRFYGPQDLVLDSGARILLYSGSFNPFHRGHHTLARIALNVANAQLTQDDQQHSPYEVIYEIALKNADKNPVSEESVIRERLAQFTPDDMVALTKAPLFIQKARMFPGCTFIVGYDTVVRILDTKYYGNSQAKLIETLVEMRQLKVQFIIGGRIEDGDFKTLSHVDVPVGFESMFIGIPESMFRDDISSTQIREERRKQKESTEGSGPVNTLSPLANGSTASNASHANTSSYEPSSGSGQESLSSTSRREGMQMSQVENS